MKTSDGLSLHTRHWRAPSPALGTAVLVHGLGEHIGRYEHVAEHLTAWLLSPLIVCTAVARPIVRGAVARR